METHMRSNSPSLDIWVFCCTRQFRGPLTRKPPAPPRRNPPDSDRSLGVLVQHTPKRPRRAADLPHKETYVSKVACRPYESVEVGVPFLRRKRRRMLTSSRRQLPPWHWSCSGSKSTCSTCCCLAKECIGRYLELTKNGDSLCMCWAVQRKRGVVETLTGGRGVR